MLNMLIILGHNLTCNLHKSMAVLKLVKVTAEMFGLINAPNFLTSVLTNTKTFFFNRSRRAEEQACLAQKTNKILSQ